MIELQVKSLISQSLVYQLEDFHQTLFENILAIFSWFSANILVYFASSFHFKLHREGDEIELNKYFIMITSLSPSSVKLVYLKMPFAPLYSPIPVNKWDRLMIIILKYHCISKILPMYTSILDVNLEVVARFLFASHRHNRNLFLSKTSETS